MRNKLLGKHNNQNSKKFLDLSNTSKRDSTVEEYLRESTHRYNIFEGKKLK